ncbi:MAG: C40 family peptidase [Bacteroidales bacterium]|jgi:SH3-like domain-containing protein|nr:C40 family peptidase [Bacteroidales bacterium]MCI2122182.1 C40 family peptidase [Bacteroidales bacterium]MCI2145598.1 C40 family peptidase [Bacteroidales bacterium]
MKRTILILVTVVLCMTAVSCNNKGSGEKTPAGADSDSFCGYAIGKLSVVQINTKPDWDAESATQALMGMTMEVRDSSDGWLEVTTPDGYEGWCPAMSVCRMDSTQYAVWLAKPEYVVNVHYTLFRREPSETSEVISDAVMGDMVLKGDPVLDANGYASIVTHDGRKGFVKESAVMDREGWLDSREATPGNIIATAREFIGFPYVWGGTSVKGMDCSGFVKTVYFMNGIILKRDASQQVKTGTEVDIANGFDNLQAGDLIFFGTEAKGGEKEKISHVALYIGDGEFLHSSGMVRYGNLRKGTTDYYERKPLRARRIIGNEDKGLGIVTIKVKQE